MSLTRPPNRSPNPAGKIAWETLSLEQALNLLDAGTEQPAINDFICILQKCRKQKDLHSAKHVYAHILRKNVQDQTGIGNHVVPMFVDCGSVSDAHEVFSKLVHRNVHSWTSLIGAYIEHGQSERAFDLYQKMQENNVCPNSYTVTALMKGCTTVQEVQRIHKEILKNNLERDLFVGSSLVDSYAKCGSLSRARDVLDELPVRSAVSWNALIAGYAEQGPAEKALDCFEQMQQEDIYPDNVTYVCILKVCGNTGALERGRELHIEIIQKGLEEELTIGNTLIDMYAKCGLILDAQKSFDKIAIKTVVSWNALIGGYVEHGLSNEALECFEKMQEMCVIQSTVTFMCGLKASGCIKALDKGRAIHTKIVQEALEKDAFVGTALIDMYAACGTLLEACHMVEKLPTQCVATWNALIAGYAECGLGQEASKCFEQMKMRNVSPNDITFACILKACSSLRNVQSGQSLHLEITAKGLERDVFVGSALVDMYAKCDSLLDAQNLFDKLPVRNIVSWTALIAGYAEHGLGQEALDCYDSMQRKGISPSNAAYAPLLKACASIGSTDRGRQIHSEIMQKGYDKDLYIGNTAIDLYSKSGSLVDARDIFERLPIKGIVAWNAMIRGYGVNHESEMALQLFEVMQEQGIKPDAVTFTCLLDACSHASLVPKGHELLKTMKEQSVVPTIDHFACMIDILARSGNLYEAEKFVNSMPCSPTRDTWVALLSACKTYAEPQIGSRCFQQLKQMNPTKAGPYMLMASVYANAGMCDEAFRIAEQRIHAGAKKKPASALIEVDNKLQAFVIGDEDIEELLATLKKLDLCMEEQGHVPNLDLVLDCTSEVIQE